MATITDSISLTAARVRPEPRRSLDDLIAPLQKIAASSPNLTASHLPEFEINGDRYQLPRYFFVGPNGGDVPIRVGIFAATHGNEPEGAHAIVRFIKLLEELPELATGYNLAFYPVCNPTGFEDGTRLSRSGHDLDREFWKNSTEPEVRLLQAELVSRSFQGIISLHTDSRSQAFSGFAQGGTLTKNLIEPALAAAAEFLPRGEFSASGALRSGRANPHAVVEGILSAPPKVRPRPFEIILETPASPPEYLKATAFLAALQTILTEYRKFIAYAPNL
jgi:hypothetical protein